jgi:monofunctional biosynthetic peptidoglycan transglycosylase
VGRLKAGLGENGANVSSGDQAGIDQSGAEPAEPSPVAAVSQTAEVEALISSAVRRIADAITPVKVLAPDPAMPATAAPVTPPDLVASELAEVEAEAVVTSTPDPELFLPADGDQVADPAIEFYQPAADVVEADQPPASVGEPEVPRAPPTVAEAVADTPPVQPPPVDPPLTYVPRDEERIAPSPAQDAETERIEPHFDTEPAAQSLTAEGPLNHGSMAPVAFAPDAARDAPAPERKRLRIFNGPWTWRRLARYAGLAVGAYFGAILFLILLYRFVNPPTTTLIAYQWLTGTEIEQEWVPIEDISSNLLRAVVVSEDWGFCNHYGVDIDALEKALELAGEGKVARGASTISMQVIKNLFLSQSKSYLRKAVEIPLTIVAETIWPKSRMLEIYLNIAEWGPGVFGAEAAARHHFKKPASRLTEREAALLAAALPNPILRDAGDPGTRTARKATVIQSRMRAAGPRVAGCAMTGRTQAADGRTSGEKPTPGWQTNVKKRAGADEGL